MKIRKQQQLRRNNLDLSDVLTTHHHHKLCVVILSISFFISKLINISLRVSSVTQHAYNELLIMKAKTYALK